MRLPAMMAGVGCLALTFGLVTVRGQRSLADLDIEFTEAKMTLRSVTEANADLQRRNEALENTVRSLTESLAIANSEAEVFRRESGELKLRLEALGIEGAGSDTAKLQQRLLKAVSDLRLATLENEALKERLLALSESLVPFLKAAVTDDVQSRMDVEAQVREASAALGETPGGAQKASAAAATLTDAMVISVKEDLSLVVANVGSSQGVRMGMPFQVWRKDSRIGLVRVVDVRDRICGAVIQNLDLKEEQINVGDRLKVDARQ